MRRCLAGVLLAWLPWSALATCQEGTADGRSFSRQAPATGLSLAALAGGARYRATERLEGGRIGNQELGNLAHAGLGLRWSRCQWQLDLALTRQVGQVDYLGRSQWGWPVSSRSRLAIDDLSVNLARTALAMGSWQLGPLLAWGQRRIHRRIGGSLLSTPLTETLHWTYLQAGVVAQGQLAAEWALSAQAGLEQGLAGRLDVHFHGQADDTRLSLGSARLGHRLQLALHWQALPGLGLQAQAWHMRQHYGGGEWQTLRRGGVAAGQLRYPGSVQTGHGLAMALRWDWR